MGHLAFLMPSNTAYFYEVLSVIKNFNKDYQKSVSEGRAMNLDDYPLSNTEEIK